jgi:signal transduction histidine kinase
MASNDRASHLAPVGEIDLEEAPPVAPALPTSDLDRMTSEFVATVSHELRTPLANMLGYVELLQDLDAGPLAPEQVRRLGVVERNGKRLLSLIENLLTVSNAGNGTFVVDRAPIDVADLVARVQNKVSPTVTQAGLEFEVSVETELPAVHGDAVQLERALLSILGNAVKFTPRAGRIDVRVGLTRDETVRFEIADTGVGLPQGECDSLFQPFFRSSISQKDATQGIGLGLHIVKLIIEGHGGQVGATSLPGEGTTVWFALPNALTANGPQ